MSDYKNKTGTTQRIYNFRKEHIYKSTVPDMMRWICMELVFMLR